MARSKPVNGTELEKYREAAGLKQDQLAEILGMAGGSSYRSVVKSGRAEPAITEAIYSWVEKGFPGHGSIVVAPDDQPQLPAPPRSADFGPYLEYVREQCKEIMVRGIRGEAVRPIPIGELYTSLPVTGGSASVLESSADGVRCKLIVGDPGSGKSTYIRWAAWNLTNADSTDFPIYIRIFELEKHIASNDRTRGAPAARPADWLKHFLAAKANEEWGLTADDFHQKLQDETTVVYLDGLDEAPDSTRRKAMASCFVDAIRVYTKARFVVTTRPAAPEFQAIAGDSKFARVDIGSWDRAAREHFAQKWYGSFFREDEARAKQEAVALITAVQTHREIRRMAGNPLMLTLIAVLHWNRKKKLPERRADLFAAILDALAEAREDRPGRLGPKDCLRTLGLLAFRMQCAPGGRVKSTSLRKAAELLQDEFQRDAQRQLIAEDKRVTAAQDFLEEEMVDSGIIVQRGDQVEFWHLTFQEYLAALKCSVLQPSALIETLFQQSRLYSADWREVMLLLGGVLAGGADENLDAIFQAALDQAERGGDGKERLVGKAKAVGLLGAMLRDLQPSRYYPRDKTGLRYDNALAEAYALFEPGSETIPVETRVAAAEALGAGDKRLRDPWDDEYWVEIPPGKSVVATLKVSRGGPNCDHEADSDERLDQGRFQKALHIGRHPVSVREYGRFLEETRGDGEEQKDDALPYYWDQQTAFPSRPVTGVSWRQAVRFCNWATEKCAEKKDWVVRLPSEEEWEFAARGMEGRKYPWGNEPPDTNRANYAGTEIGKPTPVGLFPAGTTPDGVVDMAGNVCEWTRSNDSVDTNLLRGSSFGESARWLRASFRDWLIPDVRYNYIGFRCVRE